MKKNVYIKGRGGCIVLRLQKSQSNRPVSWIKRKVNSSILLFTLFERSLSPYNKGWVKASFERSAICTTGRSNSAIPARRSCR